MEQGPYAGHTIIARCYDNHSALLMHKMSSGPGFSTRPPFRHGGHDHHDETEAGLDCVPSDQSKRNKFCLSKFSIMAAMSTGSAKLAAGKFAVYWENGSHELVTVLEEEEKKRGLLYSRYRVQGVSSCRMFVTAGCWLQPADARDMGLALTLSETVRARRNSVSAVSAPTPDATTSQYRPPAAYHSRASFQMHDGVAKYTTACRITGQNIHEISQWNFSLQPRQIPLAVKYH